MKDLNHGKRRLSGISSNGLTVIYQHEGFQMGFGTTQIGWLYGLFIIFWIVGFSNAVNLTDGLMVW